MLYSHLNDTDSLYTMEAALADDNLQNALGFTSISVSPVLRDQMVYIGSTMGRTENVFRIVDIIDSRGKEMRLITNRFDLPADEISEIFRSRWAIELFFKWIRQHVKIKHFYGRSENAVKNQIYPALITYCLAVLVQSEMKSQKSLPQITCWLKATLWKEARHWLRRFKKADVP